MDQLFEHRAIVAARQALNHRHRRHVAARQILQPLAGQGRYLPPGSQRRTVQRGLQQILGQLRIILDVLLLLALFDFVQRRLGDVDMAALDQLRHLPVEKRQQQRADMRAVSYTHLDVYKRQTLRFIEYLKENLAGFALLYLPCVLRVKQPRGL